MVYAFYETGAEAGSAGGSIMFPKGKMKALALSCDDGVEQFIKLEPAVSQVFYLWGHSYEFDTDRNWQVIEEFCRFMANREDIFYAANRQALLGI
jgi:hypothetical protein